MDMPAGEPGPSRRDDGDLTFLSGGGEMGAMMRAHDWSTSPIGAPQSWPQSLRAVVALMINSRYPMFVAWGPQLAFLYNDGYAPIFGAKHPHMLGRPFREAWSEIWGDIEPLIERALAGEATYDEDLHLVMERNGYPEDTWYSFSYSPLRDERGAIAGMFCACTETTQRVQVEAALRESEARVRAVADHLPGAVVYQITTDAEGGNRKFTYLSRRYEQITGIPTERLLADPGIAYKLIYEKDQERLAAAEERSIATMGPLDIEVRYWLGDELRWGRIISAPRRHPDGTMIWDGVQIDITEQKQAIDALRASEEQSRNVLENMGEAFVLLDRDLRVVDLNDEAVRLEGRPREDIIGQSLEESAPDAAEELTELYRGAIDSNTPVMRQFHYSWPDGRSAWIDMRAYPVNDGIALFYRDVTTSRNAEERRMALLELSDALRDLDDPETISSATMAILGRTLGASRAGFGTMDEGGRSLLVSCYWSAPGIAGRSGQFDLDPYRGFIDDLAQGQTVVIADVEADSRTRPHATALKDAGVGALINIPVVEQGEVVTIFFVNQSATRDWTTEEIDFTREVASRVRTAVERRRTEIALHRSENQLTQISDALPVLVSHIDGDMIYRYANKAYEDWFGVGREEVVGKHLRDVVGEAAFAMLHPIAAKAIAGERQSFDQLLDYKAAGKRHVHVDMIPVGEDAGGGYYALVRDIGEAKRAEAALQESEERFRQIANSAPVPMWVTQLDRNRGFVNQAYLDFLGVDYQTALTFDWRSILHLDDQERIVAESIAGEASLQPFELEARYRAADGEWHVLRSRSQPRWGPDGSHIGFIGVAHDVTEERRAQKQLLDSDARFRFFDRLSKATQNEDEPEAVMAAATRLLGEHLGVDICAYADVDPDNDTFHIRRDWSAPGVPSIVGNYSLDDFGVVAAAAQRSGEALILRDAVAELGEEQASTFSSIGIAATICMPLVKQGRLTAMMAVHSATPRDWNDEELLLVSETVERCWAHVERVGTHAELRESEQRFREQFENANDFIFTTDLEMRITSCNPAVAAALEREPGELIGTRISDYTPPETWEHNKQMLAAKLAGKGDATRYEVEVFDRRGERMTWEINSRLVRDAAGNPVGLHAIGRDVTQRIRDQQLLDEARNRAETDAAEKAAILGQLAEGVIITDAQGRITFVNDAATMLHGVAALDVPPSEYPETYHLLREDGSPYPFEELPLSRAVLQGETVTDARWRIRRPDGTEVLAIGNAQPVLDPDGRAIGAVLTIRDDTARNAAETALRNLNETLEERVAKRTTELEQAQEALRQSQKLEAMGQLTGGVAHDFNNLLTPIMGSLDLLQRRGRGDEREQRMIEGALQSAERAKILVQRLLAFARRQPLKTAPVDVRELIGGMAELIASTCGPNIRVSVAVDEALSPALADANQLEMAILNLSVNARDAMPDGGRLTLSATGEMVEADNPQRLAPGRYVRLSVADTGTGMDEATLQRAIEPFFSTKGVGRGTGLGLSMAHGLASQLGGALTISSIADVGTNVELWLPACDAAIADVEAAKPAEPERGKAGTILLVDDENLVRASTAAMLSDLGYDVVEAASTDEALWIFETGRRFDMLITDYLMPGKNGVMLAHAIRDRQPDMPVLIASGYAESEGVPAYLPRLTKPFRQADLAAAMAEAIKSDRSG